MTAALAQLAAIYARLKGDVSVLFAARENLLLPVDLVHGPSGTVIAVDELAALQLVPAHVTRAVRSRRPAGVRARGVREPLPGPVLDQRRPRARPTRQGLRIRRRAAGARVPRCAARPRRARDGPSARRPGRRGGRGRRGRLPPAAGQRSWRFSCA